MTTRKQKLDDIELIVNQLSAGIALLQMDIEQGNLKDALIQCFKMKNSESKISKIFSELFSVIEEDEKEQGLERLSRREQGIE